MVNILHRVGVVSSVDDVYTALTTIDGLAGWWASDTHGNADEGGTIEFRFGPGGFDMKVTQLVPNEKVVWEVVEGPEEWVGTEIVWELKQNDTFAIINFAHRGWREEVEFMSHCSTKWAIFLMSLKSLIETGTGQPSPDDVEIDNFD